MEPRTETLVKAVDEEAEKKEATTTEKGEEAVVIRTRTKTKEQAVGVKTREAAVGIKTKEAIGARLIGTTATTDGITIVASHTAEEAAVAVAAVAEVAAAEVVEKTAMVTLGKKSLHLPTTSTSQVCPVNSMRTS